MSVRAEPFLSIQARRAVTVPAFLSLAALIFVTAPLWVTGGLAADVLTGRSGVLPRTRALAFFALYLWCEAAGILAASLLWLVTLGGRACGAVRWLGLNAALQRRWTDALFFGARRLFSVRVVTEGLEPAPRGPLLLFVRHASTADTVLAAALVANPGKLLLRYVVKRELLRDPCIDIVGRRLPNAFVDRRGPGLEAEVEAVARLADGLDESSAVLIYPEGKRFSEERRSEAVRALEVKGRADLASIASGFRNVLPPRLRGPLALLDAARDVDVAFLEHTGFEGAASFAEFWNGSLVGATLRVRLRRISAPGIPAEGRDRWLFERWAEVDRWISEAKAAGAAGRGDP